jgi:hypothetical protein
MLQRSSLPTTSSAEIADTLQRSWEATLHDRPLLERRRQRLQALLPLPLTWQQYLLACLVPAIVTGGLALQVLLSVQIARTEFQLRSLRLEYAAVERQNSELVYAIAQQSSLEQMAQLAKQEGYVPATKREYVLRNPAAQPFAGRAAPAAATPRSAAANASGSPVTPRSGQAPDGSWLAQTRQWWAGTQDAAALAANQLWRDVTGRME